MDSYNNRPHFVLKAEYGIDLVSCRKLKTHVELYNNLTRNTWMRKKDTARSQQK